MCSIFIYCYYECLEWFEKTKVRESCISCRNVIGHISPQNQKKKKYNYILHEENEAYFSAYKNNTILYYMTLLDLS